MHFYIKACREVRFMVQLSLEIAGIMHLGDGEVMSFYHRRELSRQSGRVLVVLSILVTILVARVRLNSPCNSSCVASLAEVPPGGLGFSGVLHEEAHRSIPKSI